MKIFLLGAGASKSYAQSPTNAKMPIAKDFFQTFDSLKISSDPWVLIGAIINYLETTRSMTPLQVHDFLRSGVDIEVLHSEIERNRDELLAAANEASWMIPYKAYNQLVFLFTSVINEIQNGPVSRSHLNIAKTLSENDRIVTFNRDTLMDRALKETTPWQPDDGYGIIPNKIFRDEWCEPNPSTIAAPKILKLHGSSNWLTSHITTDGHGNIQHSHEADPSMLHVYEYAASPYACYQGRYMDGYQPFSYGYYPPNLLDVDGKKAEEGHVFLKMNMQNPFQRKGEAGHEGLDSMPLIIPPVKTKRYDFFGDLFSSIWKQAEESLAQANHIIIIGYSFPVTDIDSTNLFVQAFMKRGDIPKITIIDPSPDMIANKFSQDFGIPTSHINVFKEYFNDSWDLNRILQ
jgi:hypothetical protein